MKKLMLLVALSAACNVAGAAEKMYRCDVMMTALTGSNVLDITSKGVIVGIGAGPQVVHAGTTPFPAAGIVIRGSTFRYVAGKYAPILQSIDGYSVINADFYEDLKKYDPSSSEFEGYATINGASLPEAKGLYGFSFQKDGASSRLICNLIP